MIWRHAASCDLVTRIMDGATDPRERPNQGDCGIGVEVIQHVLRTFYATAIPRFEALLASASD